MHGAFPWGNPGKHHKYQDLCEAVCRGMAGDHLHSHLEVQVQSLIRQKANSFALLCGYTNHDATPIQVVASSQAVGRRW